MKIFACIILTLAFMGVEYWAFWGKGGPKEDTDSPAKPSVGVEFSGNKIDAPGAVFNIGTTVQSPITYDYSTKLNLNISPEQLLQLIERKAETAKPDFDKTYPGGYVLFGKAEGKTVHKLDSGPVKLSADWDKTELLHDIKRRSIRVQVFNSELTWGESIIQIGTLTAVVPFAEGKPVRIPVYSVMGFSMYCEIVDAKNGIFLIGQRKKD